MGSVGSPNSWSPYDRYKDCSQNICSIYCPQWCNMIFPPPTPFEPQDDDSGTHFSPLIISVISILASAFLLVSYYTIVSKYCRRRRIDQNPSPQLEGNQSQMTSDQWQAASTGLDEVIIKSIPVFKYKKNDGLIEGTECVVCLSEFQENERLRLMPNCNHAFHLPCIDKWLKSHSNCPICRSIVASSSQSSTLNVSSLEIQRRDDTIIVIDDSEEVGISIVSDVAPKNNSFQGSSDLENCEMRNNISEIGEEGVHQQITRSISFGSFSHQAEILLIDEDDEDLQLEDRESNSSTESELQ